MAAPYEDSSIYISENITRTQVLLGEVSKGLLAVGELQKLHHTMRDVARGMHSSVFDEYITENMRKTSQMRGKLEKAIGAARAELDLQVAFQKSFCLPDVTGPIAIRNELAVRRAEIIETEALQARQMRELPRATIKLSFDKRHIPSEVVGRAATRGMVVVTVMKPFGGPSATYPIVFADTRGVVSFQAPKGCRIKLWFLFNDFALQNAFFDDQMDSMVDDTTVSANYTVNMSASGSGRTVYNVISLT